MLILNNNMFFVFIFSINPNLLFSLKTEIKFYLNNVPSLLRCVDNGPLFYFNHFPTDYEFPQILQACDLTLSSVNQRAIIEITKLELLCEILDKKEHANEFLFFFIKMFNRFM